MLFINAFMLISRNLNVSHNETHKTGVVKLNLKKYVEFFHMLSEETRAGFIFQQKGTKEQHNFVQPA